MGQTADQLRSELDRKRAELTRDVDRIEDKVRSTFDLRHQVEEKPLQMAGLAVAAGFLLGNMIGGGRDNHSQHADAGRHGTMSYGGSRPAGTSNLAGGIYSQDMSQQMPHAQHEDQGPAFFSAMGSSVKEGFRRGAGGNSFESTLSNLSAAMLAMLLDKAKDALDSTLPGFADKFEQVTTSSSGSASGSGMGSGGTSQTERQPRTPSSAGATPAGYATAGANDRASASYPKPPAPNH